MHEFTRDKIMQKQALEIYQSAVTLLHKKMKRNREVPHLDEPVLFHIFSYQHESLHNLISKSLAKYANNNCQLLPLPITLILSSDTLIELFKDVLMRKMQIPNNSTPKWINSNVVTTAARHNNLKAMISLETHILVPFEKEIKWTEKEKESLIIISESSPMSLAAVNGNLEMIQWLIGKKCPLDSTTFSAAARGCHFDVLDWLRSNNYPWSENTSAAIASTGRLDILLWAIKSGCLVNFNDCVWECARGGHIEMFRWFMTTAANFPGASWMNYACSAAASGGYLELLQFARECGCSWDESTCAAAATYGHLELLQWAWDNGCPWDASTCEAAARCGHLELLQWARSKGCPWDAGTTLAAAKGGHLNLLHWACEQYDCPVNYKVCIPALLKKYQKRCEGKSFIYPCGDCFSDIWAGRLKWNSWSSGCPKYRIACSMEAKNHEHCKILMLWVSLTQMRVMEEEGEDEAGRG